MQQNTQYRYRIEHATSLVHSFTPWRPGIAQAITDRDYLYPERTAWDFSRQAHVATTPTGDPAFYFALETRSPGEGPERKAPAFQQPSILGS